MSKQGQSYRIKEIVDLALNDGHSLEYAIQYVQDVLQVSFDDVMDALSEDESDKKGVGT